MTKTAPQPEAATTRSCGAVFADPAWRDAWRHATVEPALADRVLTGLDNHDDEVTGVPLYRLTGSALWRGYEDDAGMVDVLPGNVAFLSSVYAISNPLNRLTEPDAVRVLDEAFEQATDWGCPLLLATNLEPGPVLDHLRSVRQSPAEIRLDATCRAVLPGSEDEFMATLGRSARSDIRRRHRRAIEQGVTFHRRWGRDAHGKLAEFLALSEQSATEHGNPPLYDLETLQAIVEVPGAVLLTAEHDDKILAGSIAFLHDDCLLVWAAGVDYSALRVYHPYVFLLRETIALAMHLGCRELDLGRGTFEFKTRHGFTPTVLTTLAYPLGDTAADTLTPLHEMDRRITAFLAL
ncbi:GNAT family N-acetyltransferase [Amycolatopsis sp. cmx-11-51]|uniref:GNAT family N-acetyltransferase n=1 Tax=Amycolatopsis sp. cmx-11-51 TaxID=2785797 RepID=UPI0039E6763D